MFFQLVPLDPQAPQKGPGMPWLGAVGMGQDPDFHFNAAAPRLSVLYFGLLLWILFENRIILLNKLLKNPHFTKMKLRYRNLTKVTQLEGMGLGLEPWPPAQANPHTT